MDPRDCIGHSAAGCANVSQELWDPFPREPDDTNTRDGPRAEKGLAAISWHTDSCRDVGRTERNVWQGIWRAAVMSALLVCFSSGGTHAEDGSEAELAYTRAAELYRSGKFPAAAEAFDAFRRQFPAHPQAAEAIFFGAESSVESGAAARAADSYRLYLERAPSSDMYMPRALFRLAECDVWLGNLRSADQLFQEFCGRYSDDPLWARAVLSRAEIAAREGRYEDARDGYERLSGEDAAEMTRAAARFGWARVEELAGRRDTARAAYEALADDPRAEAGHRRKAQLQLAYLDYASRDFASAAARLTEILATQPSPSMLVDAHYWRGMSYFAQGDFARAQEDYREALLRLPPQHGGAASLRRYAALASAQLHQWDAVAEAVDQSLQADAGGEALTDDDARWIVQLAQQAGHDGQEALAVQWLQQLLAIDADRFAANQAIQAALARWKVGPGPSAGAAGDAAKLAGTATHAEQAPAQVPPDAEAAAWQPLHALLEAGELSEVSRRIAALLGDAPGPEGLDQVCARLADAYHAEGNGAQEAEACRQLVAYYPDSRLWPAAAVRWARLLALQGNHRLAVDVLDRCLAGDCPAEVAATGWFLRGQAAGSTGRWEEVISSMQQALRVLSDERLRAQANYWIGEAYFRRQDLASAQTIFQQVEGAPAAEPAVQAMVALRQAQIEAHRSRWDAALSQAEAVAQNFPDFRQQHEADYLIGRCRAALGDLEGAREAYTRVVRSTLAAESETAAMAQWMLGETYLHDNEFEQALREFLRVEAAYAHPQWQAAGLLQAGKCCERLDRPVPAAELYARLLAQHATTPFAEQAAERLRALRSAPSSQASQRGSGK